MPDSCMPLEPASTPGLLDVPGPRRLRVLLVEDDPRTALALCRALRPLGIEVLAAPSVESALRLLASEPAFDAIVSDLRLPGAGGAEIGRRLRQPRLVAISGDDQALRLLQHFDARLLKPCAPALLAAAIRG